MYFSPVLSFFHCAVPQKKIKNSSDHLVLITLRFLYHFFFLISLETYVFQINKYPAAKSLSFVEF